MTKARDIADFKFENITDTGTEGLTLPKGSTAQRGSTEGQLRYNTDLNVLEYQNDTGNVFVGRDLIPTFSTSSGSLGTLEDTARAATNLTTQTIVASDPENSTITFSLKAGSSLPGGLTLGSNGTITGTATQVNSNTTTTFTVQASDGLSTVERQFSITVNAAFPVFDTASGSLGSIFDSQRSSYTLSPATATTSPGTISSYAIQSGSLPGGLSFNTSTLAITGTATAQSSDTTSTFTIRATNSIGNSTDRQFTILVKAPVVTSFGNTNSSQTFDTSTIKSFSILCWGGGTGGSNSHSGTTGGFSSVDVTVGNSINNVYIVVGRRGDQSNTSNSTWNGRGGNRGGATAVGGGGYSGVFTSSSPSQGSAIVIAGGAGGPGHNNNNGPYAGGDHSSSANNCCGTGGAGNGSALQGGSGGGGSAAGGGGGGGYVGGGGGGGACCGGAGGRGGSHYTSGNSDATTSNASTANNNNTGHSLWQSNWGGSGSDGRVLITH